jgi:hypothetical protein
VDDCLNEPVPGLPAGMKLVKLLPTDAVEMALEDHNPSCHRPRRPRDATLNPCPCGRSAYVLCLACNVIVRVFTACSHELRDDLRGDDFRGWV